MATRQPAPGPHRGGRRRISRTLVRGDDPAFAHPAKFAGPLYDEEQARALAAAHTWEIRRATPPELKQRDFPAGSMGPKVDAACRFVEATGGPAAIGRLADARALLTGEAGTLVSW